MIKTEKCVFCSGTGFVRMNTNPVTHKRCACQIEVGAEIKKGSSSKDLGDKMEKILTELDELSDREFEDFLARNNISNIKKGVSLKNQSLTTLKLLGEHYKKNANLIEEELKNRWHLEKRENEDAHEYMDVFLCKGCFKIAVASLKKTLHQITRHAINFSEVPEGILDFFKKHPNGKCYMISYKKLAELEGDYL